MYIIDIYMRQDNLIIYNGYHPEFFHHDLSTSEVKDIKTITVKSYENQRNRYFNLTNKLADRCLVKIQNNSFVITAEPVNKYILEEIVNIYGLDIGSMHFEHLLSDHPEDLAITILKNSRLMDKLRKWAGKASDPILNPRTISEGSIQLAQELGINHSLIMPPSLKRIVKGIYPSMKYIQKHSIKENNSKVKNYLLLKKIEKNKKDKFAPEGDVAFDLDKICDIACKLAKKGKKSIIKADLSMSGAGNVVLDTLKKRHGKSFIHLLREKQKSIVLKLLKDKAIPLSKKTGVVVNEYYHKLLFNYCYQVYSLPDLMEIKPIILYSSFMYFNPNNSQEGYQTTPKNFFQFLKKKYNINKNSPNSISYDKTPNLNTSKSYLKDTALELTKILWKKGYVGISSCDIGIIYDKGKIFFKLFEFNYGRETGNIYPYLLKERLSNFKILESPNFCISINKLRGPICYRPTNKIIDLLKEKDLYFKNKTGGNILIGHKNYIDDCHISCISISPTLAKANYYFNDLNEVFNN